MFQALIRWFRRDPIWYPETRFLGPITDQEWQELLPELSHGYDTCRPMFRAIQVLLRNKEKEMARGPKAPITEASLLEWQEEQKRMVYQAELLRYLVRLPIIATRQIKSKEERERVREKEKERDTA